MTVFVVLSWVIALVVALPLLVFSVEVLVGLWPSGNEKFDQDISRIAVIIPAHDEEDGIAATLDELFRVAPASVRILVVADNCSDRTAAIAREAGAEVIERHDTERRGKGFAVAYGRDYLQQTDAPDVVMVLDADCQFTPDSIARLAGAAVVTGRAVQAVNHCFSDLSLAPMVQISSFALMVKNLYRSRGMQRLGGPGLLTGTGMAFPWSIFRDAPIATGSIVEDLELGVAQTRSGLVPVLVDRAQVLSKAASGTAALQQRRRWEHGFLETLKTQALPILARGLTNGSRQEVLLGLHLMVPPLALLLLVAIVSLATTTGLFWLGGSLFPALIVAGALALTLTMVAAAWLAGGRRFLSGKALLTAPLYLLWKLPVYVSFFGKRQSTWNRTARRP